MGGFEVSGTGQKLDFTGTKYEGLEVTIDAAPLGLLLDVAEKYSTLTDGDVDMKAAMPIMSALVERFADVLEEWNVTRKGEPVPADLAGLRSLDAKFVLAVIGAWVTGTAEADDDLGKDSPSGGSSPEALTAAAALSSSLPSSSPPKF